MPSYTTLQAVRRQIQADTSTESDILAGLIEVASQRIEDFCGQNFDERIRSFDFTPRLGDATLEFNGRPLISIEALTNGDGTVIPSDGYTLYPTSEYPKTRLVLTPTYTFVPKPGSVAYEDTDGLYPVNFQSSEYLLADTIPYAMRAYIRDGVTISGKWGFNRQQATAFVNTGLTLNANVVANTASLTTNSAPNKKIDVGSVLRIDDEYYLVTGDVDDSTSAGFTATTLEVIAAYNGSTSAAHDAGAEVYVARVEPTIALATRQLAAALYVARNNPAGDALFTQGGSIPAPFALPRFIKDQLMPPLYNHHYGQAR